MMDYKAIWNEMCFHVHRNRNTVEDGFQAIVELLFEKLGWSLYRGEIVSQISIPVGSSSSVKPDMVIKHNGNIVLVVELKRANVTISERNAEQLKSYMRLLRLDFGILLGETLQMYRELPSSNNSPAKVCDIRFVDNSEIGIECIETLSKHGFSFDRLTDFCRKCLSDQKKYCEKPSIRPEYTEYPPARDFSYRTNTPNNSNVNFVSKSSEYGNTYKGSQIYYFACQASNSHMHVGKKNIEQKLHRMSRKEIDYNTFYFNNRPSRIRSSWITAARFKKIYESKL